MNGEIRIGDKVFSDFRVTTSKTVGATAPGADAISITGVLVDGEYGIRFNGGWGALSGQIADTTIGFKVTADEPNLIEDNTLFASAWGASSGGSAQITEQVYAKDPNDSFSTALANKYVYITDTLVKNKDHQVFKDEAGAPVALKTIWVVKDVFATGGVGANGVATISEFYQTFSQIPEPATMSLLGIGMLALARKRSRN
jgi:hypothetical protein